MKYAPSALIGRLSRSAGSTTASHNRFGAYLRNRVIPTNPQSSFQTQARTVFANFAQNWRDLTDAEQLSWVTLGQSMERTDSLGITYSLTGIQAYISVNRNLETIGATAVAFAPAFTGPDQALVVAATASAAGGTLAVTFSPSETAGLFTVIEATRPMSDGRRFAARSEFKQIAVLDDTITSPAALGAAYVARFGSIAGKAGEKIFLRSYIITELGFASTPLQNSVIIGV